MPLYSKGLKDLFSSYLHKMVYLMIFNLVCHAEKTYTVNPEIFARISFSRIALKDIIETFKNRD